MLPIPERDETSEADDEERAASVSVLPPDPRKELALKAGFVSLRDRLCRWSEQAGRSGAAGAQDEQDEQDQSFVKAFKQEHQQAESTQATAPQFASLHEFFQSKTSLRRQLEEEELLRSQRKPKMPIMKLSKEDWNVKCWEERLRPMGVRRTEAAPRDKVDETREGGESEESRRRHEVFHGRIDEVAKKLDKVREGAPQDEELFRLARNKLRTNEGSREHSWTDQLKSELSEGLHNQKLLKSRLAAQVGAAAGLVPKSPLGRPIGRICQDSDEDDD